MNNLINVFTDIFYKILSIAGMSYSQGGEDLRLAKYFKKRKSGFYVDVGAHHPRRFSNTHLFYKKGWRGINIDATPESMKLFNKVRPRDINLEIPISNKSKKISFYMFDEPALNSFSYELSKEREIFSKFKIKKIVKLTPKKLSEILDKYLPYNTKIDFMSIDVEGHEYEVLTSNNWEKYKPEYLLVELLDTHSKSSSKNDVYSFLLNENYFVIGKTGRTTIFKKRK